MCMNSYNAANAFISAELLSLCDNYVYVVAHLLLLFNADCLVCTSTDSFQF